MYEETAAVIVISEQEERDTVTLDQYSDILLEIKDQPEWRSNSDIAADYVDNMQLTEEQVKAAESLGLAPISKNYVRVIVNALLGLEAKNRVDWRVKADSDEGQDIAEAQTKWLYEVEREAGIDRVKSDVYMAMITTGVGWGYVGRNRDPTVYPYRADYVHRREIHWDWVGRKDDMSDWRYLRRRRFFQTDEVKRAFPKVDPRLLDNLVNSESYEPYLHMRDDVSMTSPFDLDKVRVAMSDYEWRDVYGRVAIAELYTSQMVEGLVLPLANGMSVEFNPQNPRHAMLIQQGAEPYAAWYKQTIKSFWLGPQKLSEEIAYEGIPYVPALGYREDLTGVPYGIVRDLIPLQDLINVLLQKAIWFLSSNRILFDSDALDQNINTIEDVLDNLNRADLAIAQNPNRQNPNALNIVNNYQEARALFDVVAATAQDMQMVVGVFNAMLGRESSATSGIAINALVEQGMTVMAKINDNFALFNRLLGNRMLDIIVSDRIGVPVEVVTGSGRSRRTIFINYPVSVLQQENQLLNQQGAQNKTVLRRVMDVKKAIESAKGNIINDLASSTTSVALQDVPSTPAYRAQQLQQLTMLIASMPAQMQAIYVPWVIELSDFPDREEMAELARKVSGMPNPGEGDDEQQQAMAAQQQQQSLALQAAAMMAKAAEMAARADKLEAEVAKIKQDMEIRATLTGVPVPQIAGVGGPVTQQESAVPVELQQATQPASDHYMAQPGIQPNLQNEVIYE